MGAYGLAESTPNAPKIVFQICLPSHAKKFGIFEKKTLSLGVRSPLFRGKFVNVHYIMYLITFLQ